MRASPSEEALISGMADLLPRLLSRVYGLAILLLYKSARIRVLDAGRIDRLLQAGETYLFCLFHGDYLLLFPHFRRLERTCIFTTQSRRGAILAGVIRFFGYEPCLIPDGSAGSAGGALEQMTRKVRQGYHAVLAVDGPLGPYQKVKHGAVVLAKTTGCALIPLGTAAAWRLVIKGRWDRYTIPLPFTRAAVAVGEPLRVPHDADPDQVEAARRRLEEELKALNARARRSLARRQGGDGV